MYLPAGTRTVYARAGGESKELEVDVNALTARLLQSDLEELLGRDIKPFIDFDHTGKAAAADPLGFKWKPGQGVFLQLEWTRSGRAAVEGKDYRYFSPAIRVDGKGNVEGLPANGAIGALVNRPGPQPPLKRRDRSASAVTASAPKPGASEVADPYAKMRTQRKVLAAFRRSHPAMSTDEVFRCLQLSNPQLWKD
jgi:hypothetical protein